MEFSLYVVGDERLLVALRSVERSLSAVGVDVAEVEQPPSSSVLIGVVSTSPYFDPHQLQLVQRLFQARRRTVAPRHARRAAAAAAADQVDTVVDVIRRQLWSSVDVVRRGQVVVAVRQKHVAFPRLPRSARLLSC